MYKTFKVTYHPYSSWPPNTSWSGMLDTGYGGQHRRCSCHFLCRRSRGSCGCSVWRSHGSRRSSVRHSVSRRPCRHTPDTGHRVSSYLSCYCQLCEKWFNVSYSILINNHPHICLTYIAKYAMWFRWKWTKIQLLILIMKLTSLFYTYLSRVTSPPLSPSTPHPHPH